MASSAPDKSGAPDATSGISAGTGKALTSSDVTKLGLRTLFLQASFNYERMQAGGFLVTQLPALQKIYKDDKKGLAAAMTDNLEFINTSPHIVAFLNGLLIAMEEAHEDRKTIKGLKLALFAPLAGIGDAIYWCTLLPIVAGVCSSMSMEGNPVGPLLFFAVYVAIFCMRIFWVHLGYDLGTRAVSKIREASEKVAKAATVLGCTVIGGLIASYVKISVASQIVVNKDVTIKMQGDFFDKILPNLLPFGYVFLMYYLLKKKQVSPVVLIVVTFVLAIALSFLGVL